MLLNPLTQSTQSIAHTEPGCLCGVLGGCLSPVTFKFYILLAQSLIHSCVLQNKMKQNKPSVLKLQQHKLAYKPLPHVYVCPSTLSEVVFIICGHAQLQVTES